MLYWDRWATVERSRRRLTLPTAAPTALPAGGDPHDSRADTLALVDGYTVEMCLLGTSAGELDASPTDLSASASAAAPSPTQQPGAITAMPSRGNGCHGSDLEILEVLSGGARDSPPAMLARQPHAAPSRGCAFAAASIALAPMGGSGENGGAVVTMFDGAGDDSFAEDASSYVAAPSDVCARVCALPRVGDVTE